LKRFLSDESNKEVLAKVEQFHNQFIRQDEILDTMIHNVNGKEQELAKFAKEYPVDVDQVHFSDHKMQRDQMQTQQKIIEN